RDAERVFRQDGALCAGVRGWNAGEDGVNDIVSKILSVVVAMSWLVALPASAAEQFDSEQAAQLHCPSDAVVWLNLRSGAIHAKGQPWYGRTQSGAYVCRKELANKAGAEATDEKSGWRKIVEDGSRTVYAASSPAAKEGHTVTILSLVDLGKASTLSDGMAFLSWETQYRFDCRKRLSRIEAASMYSGNMGEGEVAGSVIYDAPEWTPIPPGSNGELLWKFACGRK
ncbi:MAG TPA: surface-adhesin E family protein, partial [Gallionella sp.]|nr:surface-adhesin E family protein [Gallionella sp.]